MNTTRSMPAVTDSTMTTFRDFSPSQFDARGLGATDDNGDWFVVPVYYHPRTAEILETSNWEALCACMSDVDPDAVDHERHLFGHWATDFELIIVRPGSAAALEAERIVAALADYPVLDDEDHSQREYAAQLKCVEDGLRCATVELDGVELETSALVHQVWEHMFDTQTGSLDQVGRDGGGGPDRDECETVLGELGYVLCEDDVWRPESETEPVCDVPAGYDRIEGCDSCHADVCGVRTAEDGTVDRACEQGEGPFSRRS
jgi:hypothetical protein